MIEGLKQYPAYKDSGVPWLGAIPSNWEVRRNGRLFAERTETGYPDLPILEVSLKTGVRVRNFDSSLRKQVMADKEKYKRARQGDIAYNMMRMWQGAVGVAPVDGLISPAYVVARPFSGTVTEYFAYLFRTDAYMGEVNNFSRGIVSDRNRLYWDEFKQMPTPFPPPEEQSAIVRFLEHADRRIRRYIKAKRRLIALLNEQKQAIIHRAVTRGLDPNVRLKPSGIEWLSDVPEHWNALPLKRWVATRITDGPHETPPLLDDGIDFVSAESMVNGKIVFERRRGFISRDLHETFCSKCRPTRDDIFMCKSGNTTGKVVIVDTDREFSVWSPLALIRCKPSRVLPQLMFLVLQSKYVQQQVQDKCSYGTQPNLSMAAMERIVVTLPNSQDEQHELVRYITARTNAIDAALATADRGISYIGEYRTRLIADVVTGKLDVRDAVTRLPDEIDRLVSTDEADVLADGDETTDDADLDAVPEEAEA